jgi:hypothetical protein
MSQSINNSAASSAMADFAVASLASAIPSTGVASPIVISSSFSSSAAGVMTPTQSPVAPPRAQSEPASGVFDNDVQVDRILQASAATIIPESIRQVMLAKNMGNGRTLECWVNG